MAYRIPLLARLALSAAVVGSGGVPLAAQSAPATSVAKAKELVALMTSKKLGAFAIRETPGGNRFIAVMVVPDVQVLLVSAAYARPSDIEYRLYQKDYVTAYQDLRIAAIATDRFFVEDVRGDGLVAVPAKNAVPDTATNGGTQCLFEGPADPKKSKDKRMPQDAYAKAFADADSRYAQLLEGLIAELKKAAPVTPATDLR